MDIYSGFLRSVSIRLCNNHDIAICIYGIILMLFFFWCLIRRPDLRHSIRELLFLSYFMLLFMLLFLGRSHYANPFAALWGDWLPKQNEIGEWGIDCLYNLVAFIPFSFLCSFLRGKIWRSILVCGLISFILESLQAYFSVGAFQISDIVYNALSGGIGAWLYLIFHRNYKQFFFEKAADEMHTK